LPNQPLKTMENDLDLYLNFDYQDEIMWIIEQHIRLSFPNIQKLEVNTNEIGIQVTFIDERYSYKEVEFAVKNFIDKSKT